MSASERPLEGGNGSVPDELHRLFAEYIDRLNAGEALDTDEIRRAHPEHAAALIEQLREFQAFGSSSGVVDTFGPYRVLGELGRGGMGVVYEAHDAAMDRRIALKVLSAGLAVDQRSVERFRREARIVGKLRHPGIVAVYATGVETGTPYIAMEYVEGESLEKILERKRPREARRAPGVARRILSAVTRSISTDSPTVATPRPAQPPQADEEQPADEGPPAVDEPASRPDHETWSPIPASTEDMDLGHCIRMAKMFAAVAGALQHAHENDVVHRDLKPSNLILDSGGALRILDFGLARLEGQDHLTGSGEIVGTPRYMSPEQARAASEPIDHRTDVYSLGATLYEVLTLAPPFQGRTAQETISNIISREPRSPRLYNPRIPRDLETIVMKCLRKEPSDRYASARALADDLLAFSRGDPIRARPQSFLEKSSWWVRRHRGHLAVAAIVIIAAAFAARSYFESRERWRVEYADLVTDAAVKLERSGAIAETAGRFAWEGSSYNPFLLGAGLDDSFDANVHVKEAIDLLEKAIDRVPERPDAHYHLARARAIMADYERADESLDRAIELEFVPAMVIRAAVLETRGEVEQAEAVREHILERGRSDAGAAWVKTWLATYEAIRSGEWKAAGEAYAELLRMEERAGKPLYIGSSVEFYTGRGVVLLKQERYDEARDCFAAVKALRPGAVEPELFMGMLYRLRGEIDRADEVFESLWEREPTDDIAYMVALLHWARFHDFRRGLKWAERVKDEFHRELWRSSFLNGLGYSREALESARRLPELNPDAALGHFLAALAFINARDVQRGEELARRAAELAPKSSVPLTILSQALALQQRYPEALEALQKAVQLEPDAPAPNYYLGYSLVYIGQFDEGMRLIEKALDVAASVRLTMLFRDHAHYQAGHQYLGREMLDDARRHFEKAVEHARAGNTLAPAWLATLARVRWRTGDRAGALAALDEAISHHRASGDEVDDFTEQYRRFARVMDRAEPTLRDVEMLVESARRTELVGAQSEFRYFKGTSAPSDGIAWTGVEFDDGAWETARGSIGYGVGGIETTLVDMQGSYSSVFLRTELGDPPPGDAPVVLRVRADDGFVAWLNGVEIGRARAGIRATLPHDAVATSAVGRPIPFEELVIDRSAFGPPGANVLAIQGLNARIGSSDFLLDARVHVLQPPGAAVRERLVADLGERGAGNTEFAYLEGRLLQLAGDHERAVGHLGKAAEAGDFLPRAALIDSLLALGRKEQARDRLRELLDSTCPGRREHWEAWLALKLAAGRTPGDLLDALPCRSYTGPRGITPQQVHEYLDDVRWLLERLAAGEPIRINCGGVEIVAEDGTRWGSDKFSRSGGLFRDGRQEFDGQITGTRNDRPYRTERWFPSRDPREAGYSIPLPRGRYSVTFHFAEIWFSEPGQRTFDVILEGEPRLERHELPPLGVVDVQQLEIEVTDGMLEIDFRSRKDNAKISGLEIERVE